MTVLDLFDYKICIGKNSTAVWVDLTSDYTMDDGKVILRICEYIKDCKNKDELGKNFSMVYWYGMSSLSHYDRYRKTFLEKKL